MGDNETMGLHHVESSGGVDSSAEDSAVQLGLHGRTEDGDRGPVASLDDNDLDLPLGVVEVGFDDGSDSLASGLRDRQFIPPGWVDVDATADRYGC